MSYISKLSLSIVFILLVLLIIHYNDFDLKFQSFFFNYSNSSWLINRDDQDLKFVFYRLPKYLLIAYGVILIVWGIKLKVFAQNLELRKKIFFLVFALILVPLAIATMKHYSPIYCPNHIKEFGGWAARISPINIFHSNIFLQDFGKCFPAGHASGGFSLISLFFVFSNRSSKYFALSFALILGWIMGLYQIAKGAHYLSDTTVSMVISYIICLSLSEIILRKKSLGNNL